MSLLLLLLPNLLLAAFALWRLIVAWRAADRAYTEGWRDGYNLRHALDPGVLVPKEAYEALRTLQRIDVTIWPAEGRVGVHTHATPDGSDEPKVLR